MDRGGSPSRWSRVDGSASSDVLASVSTAAHPSVCLLSWCTDAGPRPRCHVVQVPIDLARFEAEHLGVELTEPAVGPGQQGERQLGVGPGGGDDPDTRREQVDERRQRLQCHAVRTVWRSSSTRTTSAPASARSLADAAANRRHSVAGERTVRSAPSRASGSKAASRNADATAAQSASTSSSPASRVSQARVSIVDSRNHADAARPRPTRRAETSVSGVVLHQLGEPSPDPLPHQHACGWRRGAQSWSSDRPLLEQSVGRHLREPRTGIHGVRRRPCARCSYALPDGRRAGGVVSGAPVRVPVSPGSTTTTGSCWPGGSAWPEPASSPTTPTATGPGPP